MWLIASDGGVTTDTADARHVALGVDLRRHSRWIPAFRVAAQGDGWTGGDYAWHPLLLPPPELIGVDHPPAMRLDLRLRVPVSAILALGWPIDNDERYRAARVIAREGSLQLVPLNMTEFRTPIAFALPFPNLDQMLDLLIESGALRPS